MALIQVTPDLLNGKATELRTLKSSHDEAMSKMRTLIMGLNEIWKGDAQDAFVAKYESMQSTFTNFTDARRVCKVNEYSSSEASGNRHRFTGHNE